MALISSLLLLIAMSGCYSPEKIQAPTVTYLMDTGETLITYKESTINFEGDIEKIRRTITVKDDKDVSRTGEETSFGYNIRERGIRFSPSLTSAGKHVSGYRDGLNVDRLEATMYEDRILIDRSIYPDNSERDLTVLVTLNGKEYELEEDN